MPLDQAVSAPAGSGEGVAAPKGDIDQLAINTIRTLAIDAVEKANSGHAGAPMGLAPVAYTLWTRFLRYDPAQPLWPNRDRFVLSNGHASHAALLAAAPGRRRARRPARASCWAGRPSAWTTSRRSASSAASRPATRNTATPPASRPPPGRSARASATSVGMAMAERWLAARFNQPGPRPLRLRRLRHLQRRRPDGGRLRRGGLARRPPEALQPCWIYDDNPSPSRARTDLAFTEDVAERFQGYGWATQHGGGRQRLRGGRPRHRGRSRPTTDRPTLIRVQQRHRLRLAAQAGHLEDPLRSARRGRGEG